MLVIRDPNFAKDPTRSEFRGFPLVNTEKLLEFIDTEVSPGEDQNVQYDMPFKVPLFAWGWGVLLLTYERIEQIETLTEPFVVVNTEPEVRKGEAPTCKDFVLRSAATEASQAFEITIGDTSEVTRIVWI